MAIIWNKLIPRWDGLTIEPPEAKKDVGYIAGDKPPAKWENWLRKGTYEALGETRDVIESIDLQLAQKPSMTTTPITLYVSTSGNDSNDGLTPATALRNIQTAINKIPQVVNHPVSIVLSAGTYNEDISISGFVGKGLFTLKGGDTLNNDYVVERIVSKANSCELFFNGVNASKVATHAIHILDCISVRVIHCSITFASIHYGIVASRANVWVENCIISNRGKGIYAYEQAHMMSVSNSGSGNTTVLESTGGSVIAKYGTQPTGTVNGTTTAGGVIR